MNSACGFSVLFGLVLICLQVFAWDVEIKTNPMCGNECQDQLPNLVHVSARSDYYSMHFFTAASLILGPPSIFIVKSSKPDAYVSLNWTRLFDNHMYDGIKVENTSDIYGLTYFSVVDFRDPNDHSDLWTASKNNKTFQEYYLSQFEYSLSHVDSAPDEKTGLIQIIYRSDARRRHKLVSNGGHFEIKVIISTNDITGQDLKAGLAFKSEISFHDLTILHPDSKLGVGIVLFSNISMLPSDDFLDTYSVSDSSVDVTSSRRVAIVHLNEKHMSPFAQVDAPINISAALPSSTPVLFSPSSVGRAGAPLGKDGSEPSRVLLGPRERLTRSGQRQKLRRSLAKALYGKKYEQSYQKIRSGGWKSEPIGMRLQRFAFSAPGQKAARYAAWPVTLTMDVDERQGVRALRASQSKNGLKYWNLFLVSWISSIYE